MGTEIARRTRAAWEPKNARPAGAKREDPTTTTSSGSQSRRRTDFSISLPATTSVVAWPELIIARARSPCSPLPSRSSCSKTKAFIVSAPGTPVWAAEDLPVSEACANVTNRTRVWVASAAASVSAITCIPPGRSPNSAVIRLSGPCPEWPRGAKTTGTCELCSNAWATEPIRYRPSTPPARAPITIASASTARA